MAAKDWSANNLLWEAPPPPPGTPATRAGFRSRHLFEAISRFALHPASNTLWRGHATDQYRLVPSGARGPNSISQGDLECQTNARLDKAASASRYWRDGVSYRSMSELDRLAHLQHHIG